jgi:beta-1,4-mannosyltransferase
MRDDLARRWRIQHAVVLYDQPARAFMAARVEHGDPAFRGRRAARLDALLRQPGQPALPQLESTVLLVSPTSWTADEDFSLLLVALETYEARGRETVTSGARCPPQLLIVITGKGPLRDPFEAKLAQQDFRFSTVLTRWLAEADYVELLALADLGLCFHRSSSGIDLPMKILDLFGAGVPVCAYDYGPCLQELVRPGETGHLFATGAQLGAALLALCDSDPGDNTLLEAMRQAVIARHTRAWEDEWRAAAASIFEIPQTPQG